ncbi:MAG: hypothetical protein JSW39_18115 [Desulfobacterales bacterium]|nr:MAG: hypothetical protein JSW39_18115 [Desulfobacterales bacterium]
MPIRLTIKMTTRRVLILAPLLLTLILLQSYFWVPTYEQQTRGNPDRLEKYITASIGDASLLNPILSADSASSEIENMVFEGLIDRDKDLRFRGRLATSWKIYEEAFFYVNGVAHVPGQGVLDPAGVAQVIRDAQKAAPPASALKSTLENIVGIQVIPSRQFRTTREGTPAPANRPKKAITLRGQAPARIKLVLHQIDPDLFANLTLLLGRDYFTSFPAQNYLQADGPLGSGQLDGWAREILPAVEHNPVIEFNLRPNVRFHDGHILDAGDVKFTYEAIIAPQNLSPRIADYEPVKAVQVLDPLTVRVVYKRLYSPGFGTWAMGILPEHLLNSEALRREAIRAGKEPANFTMRQSAFNRHPIGCGPFVFREWKSDEYIALDRFEDYWEGPPNYKAFIYRIIPDLLTQEMEFYAGTLDAYGQPPGGVPPYQTRRLENDPRFQSFSGTSFGYSYIGYNMRREPFDDPRVRRALGMAIDVDKIIKYVLYGQGKRISGPFPLQTDYYDRRIAPLPCDPEGALRLLAEAGWKRDAQGWLTKDGRRLQFTLITNSGNDIRKAILAVAQDAWKQIGIDVRTDLLEWSVFIQERVDKHDFDAVILGWSMGIDPDLYQIWHSSQTGPNQLNFVAFQDQEADRLIVAIRQEYNHQRQVDLCHELQKIIAAAQPYTFLFVREWTAVLDRRIVLREVDAAGKGVYKKITPTPTGNIMYDFNKWIKLSEVPNFAVD